MIIMKRLEQYCVVNNSLSIDDIEMIIRLKREIWNDYMHFLRSIDDPEVIQPYSTDSILLVLDAEVDIVKFAFQYLKSNINLLKIADSTIEDAKNVLRDFRRLAVVRNWQNDAKRILYTSTEMIMLTVSLHCIREKIIGHIANGSDSIEYVRKLMEINAMTANCRKVFDYATIHGVIDPFVLESYYFIEAMNCIYQ